MTLEERYCPFCDESVGNSITCPKCKKELARESRPKWVASVLGYFYGGLIGGIALFFVFLIEELMHFESRSLEMIVFGIFAVGSWQSMKDKLYYIKDDAILKKVKMVNLAELNDPKMSIGKNAYEKEQKLYVGKVDSLNFQGKNCTVKTDFGKELIKPFEDIFVKVKQE